MARQAELARLEREARENAAREEAEKKLAEFKRKQEQEAREKVSMLAYMHGVCSR